MSNKAKRIIEQFYGLPYDEALQTIKPEQEDPLDWGPDVGGEVLPEIPNAVTLASFKDIEEGHLKRYNSVDELFDDLNADE